MRKTLSVVFAVLLTLAALAGCSQSVAPSATQAATPQSQASGEPAKNVNDYGWEVPEQTMSITFYGGQDSPDAVEKRMRLIKQYLLEKFNIDINKIVFDNDGEERLAMMLAAGDYPELITCMTASQAANWKTLGKTVDMKPYIDQYSPEFVKRLGDIYKRFVDADGQMHMLPNGWGILEICDSAPQLRYDWWEELGKPAVNTPDDYFNVLSEMVAKHPTNAAGQKTYALSFIKDRNAMIQVAAMWGLKKGFKEGADNSLTYFVGIDEGWEMTKYLNRYQVAGLLDPDSFIETIDEWREKLASQRIAGHLDSWWPTRATADFWPDAIPDYNPDKNLFVHIDVKAPGVEHSGFNPKDANGYYRTIITDKCDDPVKIAKFINLENSILPMKLFGLGVPKNYDKIPADEDGAVWDYTGNDVSTWKFDEVKKQDMLNSTFNYELHSYMGPTEIWVTAYQGFTKEDGTVCWYDQNFNNDVWWKQFMNDNMKDSMYDFSAFNAIEFPADDPISIKKQQITDVVKSMFVEAVMAGSEAECRTKYDAMVAKCNELGLAELNEYYTTHYKAILDSWK